MTAPHDLAETAYGRELAVALRSLAAILVVPLAATAAALTLTGLAPNGQPLHQCLSVATAPRWAEPKDQRADASPRRSSSVPSHTAAHSSAPR
jgi:hypothetical protein